MTMRAETKHKLEAELAIVWSDIANIMDVAAPVTDYTACASEARRLIKHARVAHRIARKLERAT